MSEYTGKKAIVAGGTHGIGLAVVQALAQAGAEVLATGRNVAALQEISPAVHAVRSDVTDMADIERLGRAAAERLGQVDFVFVNVGTAAIEPFEAVTEESYDRAFTVNAKGPFFVAQRLAGLIADGGSIVFTTSVAETGGGSVFTAYSGAKAAIGAMARCVAAALLPRGIRVNMVSPGFVQTPTMGIVASDEDRAAFGRLGDELTPMKRHGQVEEVAAAVLFLAFEATFTTGATLTVDGGARHLAAS
ncbi:SDR family NAD(P)-dependent oxidoreductase [Nonomuraea typhae]|uniref:SDR family NAD(P)-dependent oxidoreductase n=1 Tax=Nonomuraea typhae TaxID=2603600 RepID=UPI0012F904AC|nr:SDR family oxidoreductase [Nonomuraea typhae]